MYGRVVLLWATPPPDEQEAHMADWLTNAEIQKEFGISDSTVRRAVRGGDLRPARSSSARNAKMRFKRSDVEQWLGIAAVQ